MSELNVRRSRRLHVIWCSILLLCVRYSERKPFFSQTCGSSVSFQTGSINHEKGCILGTFGKSRKNLFEDAHVASSDKTVIKSFIGAVFFWSILPSETELENMDNSTDNFLIVPSGNAS